MHVTTKDKKTEKDQSMTIASSSGLSDRDIERMVSESEQYPETDKACQLVIEQVNTADSVCAEIENALRDFRNSLDKEQAEKLEKYVSELRELVVKGQVGDVLVTVEAIKQKIDEINWTIKMLSHVCTLGIICRR